MWLGEEDAALAAVTNSNKNIDVKQAVLATFDRLNQNIIRDSDQDTNGIDCGVYADCPIYYDPTSITESIQYMNANIHTLQPTIDERYQLARRNSANQCQNAKVQKSGGWCLEPSRKSVGCLNVNVDPRVGCQIEPHDHGPIKVPEHHALPAKVIVEELVSLIDNNGITSFNDFGAGIGQYKAAIQNRRPSVNWTSYDGAGNIEEWTKGFVKWIDLTNPASIPVADWAISLEVGEHIPNKYEGMFLRNLHRHNCRGMILSWAILGQGGNSHINCHSGAYLIPVLEELGYTLDDGLTQQFRRGGDSHYDQYDWFKKSILVFRRNVNACSA